MLWTCAAMLLAMLPHLMRLPILLGVFATSAVIWRAVAAWRHSKPLPTWFRLALTGVAIVAVLSIFQSIIGRGAGSGLLCVMSGLKLLETYRRRDIFICLCLSYFIITIEFLFSQSLATTAWALLAGLTVTAALLNAEDRTAKRGSRQHFKKACLLLLQAIPITAVLFLLFPRLASPIWGAPNSGEARTGLSKTMSPGSISELFIDDSPAFRVTFDGPRPEPQDSYWRGLVMWDYDGFTWERSWAFSRTPVHFEDRPRPSYRYTVTLEPTDQPWLYTLDTPIEVPDNSFLTTDLQLYQSELVSQVLSYSAASIQGFVVKPEFSEIGRRAGLQLPDGYNPKTLALGAEWRSELGDDQAIVRRALNWINSDPFYYTLTPPPLGRNAMDDFLFNTREGYCEHYSSAFVVLMRAAGVPARVVTGYQGGSYNDIGDYLMLRQSDAHAWAEVWLGEGWVRVDPTSAIHPSRVLGGLGGALPASRPSFTSDFWGQFGKSWDAVRNFWNETFLKFRTGDSSSSLSAFGLDQFDQRELSIIMSIAIGLLLGVTLLTLVRKGLPIKSDPARQQWDRFTHRLKRAGMTIPECMGPRHLAAQATRQFPDRAEEIQNLTNTYVALRYGHPEQSPQLAEFARAVAGFQVTKQVK